MKSNHSQKLSALALAGILVFSSSPTWAVTIATVPIGHIGNAGDAAVTAYNGTVAWDTTTNLGGVNYGFSMGKYEVTAGQYTDFLNAVAKQDDNGLYVTPMATLSHSGITRSGTQGTYSYAVSPANANRPVTLISFWNATRFANWMHNNQPVGLQGPATTEDGSYTLTPTSMANNSVTRNATATWVVPSENEWYKAAYYNGSNGTYWTQPTSSNVQPGNNLLDLLGNNANLAGIGPYPAPIDGTHSTTAGGQFANSASPYGTFDQAGNVYEWTEGLTAWSATSGLVGRALRGGSFGDDASSSADRSLGFSVPPAAFPTYHAAVSGFRVAAVPEPSSMMLLTVGAIALAWRLRAKGPRAQ